MHEKKEIERENLTEIYSRIKKVKVTAKKAKGTGGIVVSGIKDLEKI